jgi:peptide/nickel transport system substrate-binding protein
MKKAIIIALVLACSVVAAAFPSHSQEKIYLRIGTQGEPDTLNFWASQGGAALIVQGFYPRLYYRKPVTLEPVPDACAISFEELKNTSDGLTYTFPLRTDMKWDDGNPVTAHDFELTFDLIAELRLPDYMPDITDVQYVKAVDDYTLRIKLKECTPMFEEKLIYYQAMPSQQFGPLVEEASKSSNPAEKFTDMRVDNPVSAGPFSFAQWEKGNFIKLETNETYYGKGRTIMVKGAQYTEGPFYDGIHFQFYTNIDSAIMALQMGEIDLIDAILSPGHLGMLFGNENITLEKADTIGFYYIAPNLEKEPFNDHALREALVYLIQKDFVVERVLQGYGGIAHSVVAPAAGEWYNPNVKKYGFGMTEEERMAKATQILTDAGYTVPDEEYPKGVVLLPDGSEMEPFEILTPPADYDPVRSMSGILVQEWWRKLGFPVTARPAAFGEIIEKVFVKRSYDWHVLGWALSGTGYPEHLRYFFHSDQAVKDGNNVTGYKNPECDKALEDLVSVCDHDLQVEAAWKAQEMVISDIVYCPIYYKSVIDAHRNDTFEGWFTQLEGVMGVSNSKSCILYLKPVTAAPEDVPAAGESGSGFCVGSIFMVLCTGLGALYAYKRT